MDHILAKGKLATGSTAYKMGEAIAFVSTDGKQCARMTTTDASQTFMGLCKEDVDVDKVTTGNVVVGVDLLGIGLCIAGGAFNPGDPLINNSSAQLIKQTADGPRVAIAMEKATAAGQLINVLLTPGANHTTDTTA